MGTSVTPDLASFIKEYKPGGVILFSRNLESVEQMVELTNDLQGCSPHSPLLISIDQEGGRVSRLPKGFTIFPPCDLLGRCNSAELAYAAGGDHCQRTAGGRHEHEHGAGARREQQSGQSGHRRPGLRLDAGCGL